MPDNHSAKANKLSSMRLSLTTQHLKERTAALAKGLNDALNKGKGARAPHLFSHPLSSSPPPSGSNDSQNFNIDLSVGSFETGSGLYVRLSHLPHRTPLRPHANTPSSIMR